MKLYDFIAPTKLKNVSDSNIYTDTNFETTDLIYIQSKEDIVDHVNNRLWALEHTIVLFGVLFGVYWNSTIAKS